MRLGVMPHKGALWGQCGTLRCHAARCVRKTPQAGGREQEAKVPQRLTLRVTALYAANRVAESSARLGPCGLRSHDAEPAGAGSGTRILMRVHWRTAAQPPEAVAPLLFAWHTRSDRKARRRLTPRSARTPPRRPAGFESAALMGSWRSRCAGAQVLRSPRGARRRWPPASIWRRLRWFEE
jgi:hypothetical protein